MSLINETLDNLKRTKEDTLILNPSSSRNVRYDSEEKARSFQNLLIVLISSGIVVTLFYIAYHMQFAGYFREAQHFMSSKSAWISKNTTTLKQKLSYVSANVQAKTAKMTYPIAQHKYYQAMDLLNEGKAEQAKQDLKLIIDEYPDFEPARKVYALLQAER